MRWEVRCINTIIKSGAVKSVQANWTLAELEKSGLFKGQTRAGEMVQWLRILAVLAEEQDLVTNTHTEAHNCL